MISYDKKYYQDISNTSLIAFYRKTLEMVCMYKNYCNSTHNRGIKEEYEYRLKNHKNELLLRGLASEIID